MQPLTAAPRTQYSEAQILALLQAPDLRGTDFGLELLTPALALVEDISEDVAAWTVSHDNLAVQHGSLSLTVSRELAWGAARVKPYKLLSSPSCGMTDVRFNQGVYLLTTPSLPLGETPITYTVTGYDQLHLLQKSIGDSYPVLAGANVLVAVRAALTAAGVLAPVLLDGSATAAVLGSDMPFPLTSGEQSTWLQVVNGLLAAINYHGIWCDWDGAFRSGPDALPEVRPVEYTFAVGDLKTGVVSPERSLTGDVWGTPNRWVGIVNGLSFPPTEGNGRYTTENLVTGLSSQASVGVVPLVVFLDAVDQASLVAQVDRIKAAAMRSTEVITCKLGPFPTLWHSDRLNWSDSAMGIDRKCVARSWSLPSGTDDGDLILETI